MLDNPDGSQQIYDRVRELLGLERPAGGIFHAAARRAWPVCRPAAGYCSPMQTALHVLIAPALVAVATLAARRWDQRVGGLVSAFPAIAGPVLLIDAERHGTAFAARAATATVLGVVALSAFAVAYGRTAPGATWRVSLLAGWVAAASAAAVAGATQAGLLVAVGAAGGSLLLAHGALAAVAPPAGVPAGADGDLLLRMASTAILVVALAALAGMVGPEVGGILTALPVLASVLAVFTHRRLGPAAVVALLRGMLAGMAGFGLFCAVIALLVDRAGVGPAFAAAALAALAAQAATLSVAPAPRSAVGAP